MSKIAVTGSTGQLGALIINQLKSRVAASRIVALARNVDKAAALGVEARLADYNKPETLPAALASIETLILVSSNEIGPRQAQHRAVIDAAKAAGVKWIVYTSLLHADRSPISLLAADHLDTEKALIESGLAFTLLRNGWYTENYTGSVPGAVAGGAFLGCAGDAKICSAPRAEYAEAAAIVLTSEGHQGETYELAGDVPYTLNELAAEISRQTGKTIPYKDLTEPEYAAALAGIGLPAPLAGAYAAFDTGAAKGGLFDDSHTLSKLLGRPTTPLAESISAALKN